MEQKEYFDYLLNLAGLPQMEVEPSEFSDNLMYLFQCFRPDGTNVEKVFAPLPGGEAFAKRIMPIYAATATQLAAAAQEGVTPGYFIPSRSDLPEAEIIKAGQALIENLKLFAAHIDNEEMAEALEAIETVRMVDEDLGEEESDTDLLVLEAIGDWTYENQDEDEPVAILHDAYYSVANDFMLSYYFEYPRYTDKPDADVFAPYFTLWKAGYTCRFDENELLIGPQ